MLPVLGPSPPESPNHGVWVSYIVFEVLTTRDEESTSYIKLSQEKLGLGLYLIFPYARRQILPPISPKNSEGALIIPTTKYE
jgi:hypothetical protein